MYNVIYMVELVDCQSQYHCHRATPHVQGYRQNNAFMTTQGPLENTVEDLWRMVWEMNSHTIVMLCGLREDNQVRDAQAQSMDVYIRVCSVHRAMGLNLPMVYIYVDVFCYCFSLNYRFQF